MKHSFEHYLSKILGWVLLAAFSVGCVTLLVWLVKLFLSVIGVIHNG